MAMKLVPISLEEYRALYDAGAWVYGHDNNQDSWILGCRSDTENDLLRNVDWPHCFTRVEQEQS